MKRWTLKQMEKPNAEDILKKMSPFGEAELTPAWVLQAMNEYGSQLLEYAANKNRWPSKKSILEIKNDSKQ